jgi:hypothetical protein
MKHIACSKMWTDLTISIPRKQIKHCCKRRFSKISEDDIDRLGLEVFQFSADIASERRYTINENKLPPGCSECIDMWPNSYWHLWNGWKDREWDRQELLEFEEKSITKLIEITLSSTCNMTCMYCAPNISSQWNTLLNKPLEDDAVYKRKMLDALYGYIEKYQIPATHRPLHYDFLGGEPLLDLEVFDVIEKLLELHSTNKEKEVTISMISNLNVKPKLVERLVQRAIENPQVNWMLKISVDALGVIGETQRDGLDLKLWEQNLRTLINSPIKILILPTVTNVSLIGLPELIVYITELFEEYNQLDTYGESWLFGENMVMDPLAMHVGTLPHKYIDVVEQCVHIAKTHIPDRKGKRKFVAFLENLGKLIGTKRSDADLAEVKRFFEWQGNLKNKDYLSLFPSLKDIIK